MTFFVFVPSPLSGLPEAFLVCVRVVYVHVSSLPGGTRGRLVSTRTVTSVRLTWVSVPSSGTLAMGPWESDFVSWNFSFLLCEAGMVTPPAQGDGEDHVDSVWAPPGAGWAETQKRALPLLPGQETQQQQQQQQRPRARKEHHGFRLQTAPRARMAWGAESPWHELVIQGEFWAQSGQEFSIYFRMCTKVPLTSWPNSSITPKTVIKIFEASFSSIFYEPGPFLVPLPGYPISRSQSSVNLALSLSPLYQ